MDLDEFSQDISVKGRPAERPAVERPGVDLFVVDRSAVDRPAVDRRAVDRPIVDRHFVGRHDQPENWRKYLLYIIYYNVK